MARLIELRLPEVDDHEVVGAGGGPVGRAVSPR